ncbi:hypothetical protein EXS65_04865 [Candidatus Peribacteria bacterium]|nr:hypothetical protein [Candidatus Peribacteria bacterium]
MISEIASKSGSPVPNLDRWIFRDREAIEQRFGMELEKVLEMYHSDSGRKELLLKMKQIDPSLNGNINQALETVTDNMKELKTKESFLMKMVKLPIRTVKAVANAVMKHPVLSALGALAVIAALVYFFGPAAVGTGEVGTAAAGAFKDTVLGKVVVPTPGMGVGAAADLPVTGGLSDVAAGGMAESAGSLAGESGRFIEGARISEAAVDSIRSAADAIAKDPKIRTVDPIGTFFELMENSSK